MSADPAATYERLKIETAEMLKLDATNLSLVEGLQLDLIAMLRLEVDGLQGQVLAGDSVDLARLSTALGMLRQLLPAQALVASPAAAPETRFGPSARERLRQLIEKTVLREDPREAELRRDILAREEMAAVIAAGGTIEAAPSAPTPVAPSPEPPLPDNVVPIANATERANSRMPPEHYLADYQRQHERWRDGAAGASFEVPPWPLPQR